MLVANTMYADTQPPPPLPPSPHRSMLTCPAQQDLDDVGKDSYHHVSGASTDNHESLVG